MSPTPVPTPLSHFPSSKKFRATFLKEYHGPILDRLALSSNIRIDESRYVIHLLDDQCVNRIGTFTCIHVWMDLSLSLVACPFYRYGIAGLYVSRLFDVRHMNKPCIREDVQSCRPYAKAVETKTMFI